MLQRALGSQIKGGWSSCIHMLQYSVTQTDLGQVSMSPNLICEKRVGHMPRFVSGFVLPRLFEKRFYTK